MKFKGDSLIQLLKGVEQSKLAIHIKKMHFLALIFLIDKYSIKQEVYIFYFIKTFPKPLACSWSKEKMKKIYSQNGSVFLFCLYSL